MMLMALRAVATYAMRSRAFDCQYASSVGYSRHTAAIDIARGCCHATQAPRVEMRFVRAACSMLPPARVASRVQNACGAAAPDFSLLPARFAPANAATIYMSI